jgi:hypothetical protein
MDDPPTSFDSGNPETTMSQRTPAYASADITFIDIDIDEDDDFDEWTVDELERSADLGSVWSARADDDSRE